jgi:hypothetical protein
VSRLALTSDAGEPAKFISSACRDTSGELLRDRNGTLLAACGRCGVTRAVNESRTIPELCVDCRTAERWTPEPTDADGLRAGSWVQRGLTLVWLRDQPRPHGPREEYDKAYTAQLLPRIVAGIVAEVSAGKSSLAPHRICSCGCLCHVVEVCPACGQTGL